jgi:hypothetical protein
MSLEVSIDEIKNGWLVSCEYFDEQEFVMTKEEAVLKAKEYIDKMMAETEK